MVPSVPLFVGLPGGMELAVMVFVLLLLVVPVVLFVGAVGFAVRYAGGGADEERVDALERRVVALERALDDEESGER